MASYNKFQDFVRALCAGEHDLMETSDADQLKIYLSNAAPSAADDAVKADLAEITNENGYAAPVDVVNQASESAGTVTLQGTSLTITASGGTVGPFRYVVLYNDTHTSDGLICWWDYGSSITLQDGESFTVKFNDAAVGVLGNIFTLA